MLAREEDFRRQALRVLNKESREFLRRWALGADLGRPVRSRLTFSLSASVIQNYQRGEGPGLERLMINLGRILNKPKKVSTASHALQKSRA